MEKKQHIVAIEIGSSKVVGAVAERTGENRITVSHLYPEPQSNCVSYGQVQNVENIKGCVTRILRNIEHDLKGTVTQLFVGMSGRSLHSEASEINRSIDASQPITSETIETLLREGSRNSIKQYQTLDAVPRAFFVDKKQVTGASPAGQYGNSLKIQFNMIVANPTVKLNLTRSVSSLCSNISYIITPLAMGRHILTAEEKTRGCMLVDLGAETTTVAIYKDGLLQYLNTLPLGGRNLTLDVANGKGITEENAERIKKNINNPLDLQQVDSIVVEGVNSKEAAQYINARTGEIIANVNKQLDWANMKTADLSSVVITGGAAQLKGIGKKIEEIVKVPVREANMPSNVYFEPSSRANEPQYVEVVSLLAEAARTIDPMSTCVDIITYNDGDFDVDPGSNARKKDPAPEPEPDKKKKGFFGKLQDRLNGLMTEPVDDL